MDNGINGNGRFLIAKYVPDMRQMEPRNIGVIVWAHGLVAIRFAGEGEPYPEHLAIHSKTDYEHWLDYWKFQANRDELAINGGDAVPRHSPKFVDALMSKARDKYMLVDGGLLLDEINESNIKKVAKGLFERLVRVSKASQKSDVSQHRKRVASACDTLFKDSGLSDRNDFHARSSYPIECEKENTRQKISFNYTIGNGAPIAVFQRVIPSELPSFATSAFCFECVRDASVLPIDRCGALVDLSSTDETSNPRIDLLTHLATIIPIDDRRKAIDMLQEMAR